MKSRREITTYSQVVDVRAWGDRAAEWLSSPANLAMVTGGIVFVMLLAPVLFIVAAPAFLVCYFTSINTADLMPFRYPVGVKDPKGKTGQGILYFGNIYVDKRKDQRLPLDDIADQFKECWLEDGDLRMHFFILGSTGSGKSETLKGIFFSALTWGSGFFVADGKADNKLALDNFAMARMFGRDDDLLVLNFLLAGKTPEEVTNSKVKRTNGLNPFYLNDADTIIQMGSNLLPKAEGEGKAWQDRALNFWRAIVPPLVYKRDTNNTPLNIADFIEHLSLTKVEELYAEGAKMARKKSGDLDRYDLVEMWPDAYLGVKSYLESGLPGFKIDRLVKKYRLVSDGAAPVPNSVFASAAGRATDNKTEQETAAIDQHGYRASQMSPALNLLDRTYGHIFRAAMSEIEMVDVTLNNRILSMMIPSLEKSAMEAENLGKLAVACLRTMMGKNLGADIEGSRIRVLESKATESPTPYVVALDELGYYFSDGLAVMFAQARSLGFCMIAAAQDVEKLMEGSRAAEAGAMLANSFAKYFMRIDDANKTNELIQKYLGEANVAVREDYDWNGEFGHKRTQKIVVKKVPVATLQNLQALEKGQGILSAMGQRFKIVNLYVGDFLSKHKVEQFHVNRFMQIQPHTQEEIDLFSVPGVNAKDPYKLGGQMLEVLRGIRSVDPHEVAEQKEYAARYDAALDMVNQVSDIARGLPASVVGAKRGIVMYQAALAALNRLPSAPIAVPPPVAVGGSSGSGSSSGGAAHAAKPSNPMLSEASGLPHRDVIGPVLKTSLAALPAGEEDPFDFFNEDTPLERKSAQSILADTKAGAALSVESSSPSSSPGEPLRPHVAAPPVVASPATPLGRLPESMDLAVQNLLGMAMELQLASKRNPPTNAMNSPQAAGDDWVGDALTLTRAALAQRGETLVGFTPQAKDALTALEAALGNPQPGQGASIVEQMVAEKSTPTPLPEGEPDDVEAAFDDIVKTLNL